MKPTFILAAMLSVPACAHAQVAKPCEELKSEIAQKLEAKGVTSYTLEIVTRDKEVTEGKAVGSCDGGTKKIVYRRGAAESTPAKETSKP